MHALNIAFLGGGNMGRAIVGGLRADPAWDAARLHVADPDPAASDALGALPGVVVSADNEAAVGSADVVVLAVKPQIMREVAEGIAERLAARNALVVSIAAGITTGALTGWLGPRTRLVRAMPNTPALVRRGVSALYATDAVPAEGRAVAERILGAVGVVEWVDDEELLDAVTALSGSGPAYVFLFLECLENAATGLGLPAPLARRLALETVAGAAELARGGVEPARLRAQVTSRGGTTERALAVLADGGLEPLLARALAAAATRSRELAREYGQ